MSWYSQDGDREIAQMESMWRTYSGIIKDIRARIVNFVWCNKDVSGAYLFGVYFFDGDKGRVDVWPLQDRLAISYAKSQKA